MLIPLKVSRELSTVKICSSCYKGQIPTFTSLPEDNEEDRAKYRAWIMMVCNKCLEEMGFE